MVDLFEHQGKALNKLKTGSILKGKTGSGKSLTALAYYFCNVCGGKVRVEGKGQFEMMNNPRDLYIITTAQKRDKLEWEGELGYFLLSTSEENYNGVRVVVDSWNNIKKYLNVCGAFFIFDEQRVVGSGTWVKSFLQISKKNQWILLTATPGDTWMDYIPVFIANGFYKNRTEFVKRHVIFNRFSRYPKVEKYIDVDRLTKIRDLVLVNMDYERETTAHHNHLIVPYDSKLYFDVLKTRWNIYKDQPIKNAAELSYTLRRVVNSDPRRIESLKEIIETVPRCIIFYNFDYELELLRNLCKDNGYFKAEWNGHMHQPIPKKEKTWVYLVQYAAGSEGWNCIETNVIIFYSLNHSYKMTVQAEGRIDRLNTPFTDLFYYILKSKSNIDKSIEDCLANKKDFNGDKYGKELMENDILTQKWGS